MRSDAMGHQLLPKRIALPIFASDALSSVAYAPDEVLLTLALAGSMAALQSVWVGVVVALVLAVVVASYRQTVHAYPSGGGDYEVVTTNLGRSWGLLVASALLVDYILTVAVSISSGANYITTAVPALLGHEVGHRAPGSRSDGRLRPRCSPRSRGRPRRTRGRLPPHAGLLIGLRSPHRRRGDL